MKYSRGGLSLFLPLLLTLLLLLCFPGILRTAHDVPPAEGRFEPVESIPIPASARKETVRLIFAGDIMTHSQQFKAARSGDGYDFAPQFERVRALLSSADIVAGNLETTLSGSAVPYSGYPRFNTPDSLLDALRGAGFNLLFLANNHAMDYGTDGFRRTLETVRGRGFYAAGGDEGEGGNILSIDVRGVRIAFLNYTYGYNAAPGQGKPGPRPALLKYERVLEDIAAARGSSADMVVVYPHWGIEDSSRVTDEQREWAGAFRDAGADIVVGAHPHVLQEVEIRSGGGVRIAAWSLGNFISSQRSPAQQASVLLAVEIAKDDSGARVEKISIAPVHTERSNRPGVSRRVVPAPPWIAESVLAALKIKSADLPEEVDGFGYHTIFEETPM